MLNKEVMLEEGQLDSIMRTVLGNDLVDIGSQWFGSIFKSLRMSCIHNIGSFGMSYTTLVMEKFGKEVMIANRNEGFDLFIDGKPVEVKTSFESKEGTFNINQLRPFADFKYVIFCTVESNGNVSLFKVSNKKIRRAIDNGFITRQHDNKAEVPAELYSISGDLDTIIDLVEFNEIETDGVVSDSDTRKVIDELMHNHEVNNGHMNGSPFELALYAPAKIAHLGRNLGKAIFENFGVSGRIKNMNRKINEINGGDDDMLFRTSRVSADGTYRINQLRTDEVYDYLYLICLNEDDFEMYYCNRYDVVDAINSGKIGNQHNDRHGDGQTGMCATHGTIEELKERLNLIKA